MCGNLLVELAKKYEDTSFKDSVSELWLDTQELYEEHDVGDRLAKLTRTVSIGGKKVMGPRH